MSTLSGEFVFFQLGLDSHLIDVRFRRLLGQWSSGKSCGDRKFTVVGLVLVVNALLRVLFVLNSPSVVNFMPQLV
jgi:hypothetical protein